MASEVRPASVSLQTSFISGYLDGVGISGFRTQCSKQTFQPITSVEFESVAVTLGLSCSTERARRADGSTSRYRTVVRAPNSPAATTRRADFAF